MRFLPTIFILGALSAVMGGVVLSSVPAYAASGTQQGIVAVVNEDAISLQDLEKRMKLIMASSGLPNKPEIKQRLAQQLIGGLVEEQLMIQEGRRRKITVMPAEIDQGFAKVAQQNKMSAEQFQGVLKKGGIDISTLRRQIESQITWSKVVQDVLRPRVVISDMDVEDAMARLKAKIGTTEYLAAEIYLPVPDPKKEGEVVSLVQQMLREIRSGKASFFQLAQQFSMGAGSSRGGDVGWLNETQVSSEVLAALQKTKPNQVTDPVKSLTGYHLFFVRETRTMTEDTMPSRDQVYHNIGNERLDRLQRKHMMDLKTSSFIDIRV